MGNQPLEGLHQPLEAFPRISPPVSFFFFGLFWGSLCFRLPGNKSHCLVRSQATLHRFLAQLRSRSRTTLLGALGQCSRLWRQMSHLGGSSLVRLPWETNRKSSNYFVGAPKKRHAHTQTFCFQGGKLPNRSDNLTSKLRNWESNCERKRLRALVKLTQFQALSRHVPFQKRL